MLFSIKPGIIWKSKKKQKKRHFERANFESSNHEYARPGNICWDKSERKQNLYLGYLNVRVWKGQLVYFQLLIREKTDYW